MRITIELPDELHRLAKSRAALSGISLRQFLIEAVLQKLATPKPKTRKDLPVIGSANGPKIDPTREQIDEAMFG